MSTAHRFEAGAKILSTDSAHSKQPIHKSVHRLHARSPLIAFVLRLGNILSQVWVNLILEGTRRYLKPGVIGMDKN